MAKTSVTFAVIFFFISVFFVISHARTSFNLPANEWKSVTTTPSSSSSSESDTKSSEENFHKIQLPSEKSESDVVEKGEFVHPIEEVENLPESDTTTTTTTAIAAIGIAEPFKVTYDVSFRPINRHFHHMHMNHPLLYRFPHRHNCHHHHQRYHGNGNDKSSSVREISYGNDMILSSSGVDERKSAGFVHPMFRGDMRHIIPARLGQFRAGGDRFPVKSFRVNGDVLTKEMFKTLRNVEGDGEVEMEDKKETGFMKRFRKFLFDRF